MTFRYLRSFIVALAMAVLGAPVVFAHPHIFVEARSRLVLNEDGFAVAVKHVFRFDDAYSVFAVQGFDTNQDGKYSPEELRELAEVNVESMADFGFFTFGDDTKVELDFTAPTDFWLELATVSIDDYWAMKPEDIEAMREDARLNGGSVPETVDLLELHFTLPLKEPVSAANTITLDVYDPTYYVDFRFSRAEGALGVDNSASACKVERRDPPPLDDAVAYALAQIGPDQRDLPPELQSAAQTQVNQMVVVCGGNDLLAANASPTTGEQAASAPVSETSTDSPAVLTDPVETVVKTGPFDAFFGKIAALQKDFYQKLVGALRAFQTNPNAAWLLIGLSFGYGVFHAAGPGHGKAIISSYVLANHETLKKGILLSFLSAFAQAVTAILLVGGAALVFRMTSIAIQNTARWFEIGSYALVTVLGLWLLWQKAGRPLLQKLGGKSAGGHSHHDHHHDHDHDHDHDHVHGSAHHHHHHHDHHGPDGACSTCGHVHAPTPAMVEGKMSIAKMTSVILAVGLRPCSGALVVLVFALSQGMVLAGIGATLAMAVGTALTVSVLAGLAVGAKGVAVRLFGHDSSTTAYVLNSIEFAAALVVFLLGATLLTAAIGWG